MKASGSPQGQAIDSSIFAPDQSGGERRSAVVRAEVILDRAHFSPGVIDGKEGPNFWRALAAFDAVHRITPSVRSSKLKQARLDAASWTALIATDDGPVTQDYTLTEGDVRGPFLRTKRKSLAEIEQAIGEGIVGFESAREGLAEKFHMDEDLLVALNPGVLFREAGTRIVVTRPAEGPLPSVKRIEVNKMINQVRVFGDDDNLVAVFPTTIGSSDSPSPTDRLTVESVDFNPDYDYDPSRLTIKWAGLEKHHINAGPRNPVGSTWIQLSEPTYGIHGTPAPSQIGGGASHGCVRLTNWDADALGHGVQIRIADGRHATTVEFVGSRPND